MKETTDFINAETGEVLYTIDKFLDTLICPEDIKQAIAIATGLVGSIIVISVYDYEDGTATCITATLKHLLEYGKNED